ncbi:hypothetical protein DFH27DRAFT_284090 [Peziza echinospora]|nr:hypothetical protein DFH27DRAFT_284090 [Peziza echinospora]
MHTLSITGLVLAAGATLSSAHFSVTYPWWRGDSFATQWTYPCGGVNQSISATNRTKWPLDGGALVFQPSHTHAQTYVNLGFGNEVSRLNVVLVAPFNQTGNGTFCFPKIRLPDSVRGNATEGVNATLQVIQLSSTGGALYNCADITFSADVAELSDSVCFNSTGVGAANFEYAEVEPKTKDNTTTGGGECQKSGASILGASGVAALAAAAAAAALFA